MKRIITVVALAALALAVSVFEIIYIPSRVDYFTEEIDLADGLIKSGDYKAASEELSRLGAEWLGDSRTADIFLYHDYVDEISADLLAMQSYAENESGGEYYAQSRVTKQRLASLKESELVLFENIF